MTRLADIAEAWIGLQTPDVVSRVRPHVIRAARGHETKAAKLTAMFQASSTASVTSDEIRIANVGGVIPKLRDAGATIETFRQGRAALYVYHSGPADLGQAIRRDTKKDRRRGVFHDRYKPIPAGTDIFAEIRAEQTG